MTKKKNNLIDISAEEMLEAMDIARGMSYEEIQELLKSNPLYKLITESTDKKEPPQWHIKRK